MSDKMKTEFDSDINMQDIAIIGISCRFPEAPNKEAFWSNLINDRECITFLTDEQIQCDRHLITNPAYVPASGIIDQYDHFDAELFGISERTAALMTPEHRVFFESAWDVMMDAGYDASSFSGDVAVYGACNTQSIATYSPPPDWITASDAVLEESQAWLPDALAPYTLYHLGLTGESMTINALCAGFHSAVHFACQSLLLNQVEMAIAGGVMIRLPHMRGYLWEKDKPLSRDGHSRPFDAKATGGALASGVATLLLKPLSAAIADRDNIYSVIKGTAINNNGAKSMGFGVYHLDRLAACIASSLAAAEVSPNTISMVEAVGASMLVSDAVEFNATKLAFGTKETNYCSLGAVKGNLGHAGVAAGGASAIKAILSIYNGIIPKSLNFDEPNPNIDFASSPFYMQQETSLWKSNCGIRRASVNALGGAGYNANMILEQAPNRPSREPYNNQPVLVLVSAHNANSLKKQLEKLYEWTLTNPSARLDDVAYTLHVGRKEMKYRWAIVISSLSELSEQLLKAYKEQSFGLPRDSEKVFNDSLMCLKDGKLVFKDASSLASRGHLSELANAWMSGHSISRGAFYRDREVYRIPLPAYSFTRQRYVREYYR
ncbi:MAG: type I polyketide synthase [Alphaproteobacteria bacterium]|nr:type I polyketide synthase [Alphaproteobacteria bacterium]